MSEIQLGYTLISTIGFLFIIGTASIVFSILFDDKDISKYKFSPPSSDKKLSFDTEDDIPLQDLLVNDEIIGDFDE